MIVYCTMYIHMYTCMTCIMYTVKKGCSCNTFWGVRLDVVVWHPRGVKGGAHATLLRCSCNTPAGAHAHSCSVTAAWWGAVQLSRRCCARLYSGTLAPWRCYSTPLQGNMHACMHAAFKCIGISEYKYMYKDTGKSYKNELNFKWWQYSLYSVWYTLFVFNV